MRVVSKRILPSYLAVPAFMGSLCKDFTRKLTFHALTTLVESDVQYNMSRPLRVLYSTSVTYIFKKNSVANLLWFVTYL